MDTNKHSAPQGQREVRLSCDLTGAAPLTEHVRALRVALIRALATPATVEQIVARMGMVSAAVLPHLLQLAAEGCIVRHGLDVFALACEPDGTTHRKRPPPRPQPIRDAILAYLSEARQAKEVATQGFCIKRRAYG